jgi:hypothetical protein
MFSCYTQDSSHELRRIRLSKYSHVLVTEWQIQSPTYNMIAKPTTGPIEKAAHNITSSVVLVGELPSRQITTGLRACPRPFLVRHRNSAKGGTGGKYLNQLKASSIIDQPSVIKGASVSEVSAKVDAFVAKRLAAEDVDDLSHRDDADFDFFHKIMNTRCNALYS